MDHATASPGRAARFLRWLWRRLWSRGMAWTLVVLVSLIVLCWQFENWRSARELADARRRLIERLGTDDLMTYSPATIPDEQNFFAIPVIQSWGVRRKDMSPFLVYEMPDDILPKDYLCPEIKDSDGVSRMDLDDWVKKRAAAGKPLAPGESPAAVMERDLGDAHGIIPKLVSGLDRPFSCLKPSEREGVAEAHGNPGMIKIPNVRNLNLFVQSLGLHMRAAARCGDVRKAQETGLVALRFGEAASAHEGFIGGLIGIAMHGIIFLTYNEALACPIWDDASLSRLQTQLAKINDIEIIDRGLGEQALWGYREGLFMRDERRHDPALPVFDMEGLATPVRSPWWLRSLAYAERLAVVYGPVGWHDANIAYYVDGMLEVLGPRKNAAWLDGRARYDKIKARLSQKQTFWGACNPRRFMGAYALPSIGNIDGAAAQCLFQRRSLIIGCALERYRMAHGVYPSALSEVQQELSAFHVNDPARPDQPLGYRLEEKGYLLWSAGQDAKDDGGDPEKDWIWRMRRD